MRKRRKAVSVETPTKGFHDLEELIVRLPDSSFRMILAYALRERDWGWITTYAETIGITAGAAKVRWHRLRKHLRSELATRGWPEKDRAELTNGFYLRLAVESDAVRESLASRNLLQEEVGPNHRSGQATCD